MAAKLTALATALLCSATAVPAASAGTGDPALPPVAAISATLKQAPPNLTFTVETAGKWKPPQLASAEGRYLCLQFEEPKSPLLKGREICVRGSDKNAMRARLVKRNDGKVASARNLKGTVALRGRSRLIATFAQSELQLKAGRLRWVVSSGWSGSGCPVTDPPTPVCTARYPDQGFKEAPVKNIKLAGCKTKLPLSRRSGPANSKRVAITFDDGPGPATASILNTLKRYDARATFFVLGQRVGSHTVLLKKMLKEGHEVANHSYGHHALPGYADLSSSNSRIKAATGFRPCLFRPPYGSVNSTLVSRAGSLGMMTVLWSVDPFDWRTPGAGPIASRVLSATGPGSIVLLHDGGGPRGQTVAALNVILKSLKGRGYRFETVSQLLGLKQIWSLDSDF